MPKQTEGRHILVAVDGGGTKTEYCVHDMETSRDTCYVYGGTNYKSVGRQAARESLQQAFQEICTAEQLTPQTDIAGVVFGIAGCDSADNYREYGEIISHLGLPEERVRLYNDCELAFLSAADPPGICVVAGTGSIAAGIPRAGPVLRCGGWGHHLSDMGSGYWLGRRVLTDMLLHCDGLGPGRAVFERICAFYQIHSMDDAPFVLTDLDVPEIAAAAKPVLDSAAAGDAYCRERVAEVVGHLLVLAKGLCRRLGFADNAEVNVVLAGSLFKDTPMREAFKERLSASLALAPHFILVTDSTSKAALQLARKIFAPNG